MNALYLVSTDESPMVPLGIFENLELAKDAGETYRFLKDKRYRIHELNQNFLYSDKEPKLVPMPSKISNEDKLVIAQLAVKIVSKQFAFWVLREKRGDVRDWNRFPEVAARNAATQFLINVHLPEDQHELAKELVLSQAENWAKELINEMSQNVDRNWNGDRK